MSKLRATSYLSRAEQVALARLAASGDRKAAGRLIESSKGFILLRVRKLAAAALRDDPTLADDLYGEGCRGMFEALLRYDASRPVHPLTYCAHWIDLRIRNALSLASGPASVGSPQHWRALGRPQTTSVSLEAVTDTLPDDARRADDLLSEDSETRQQRVRLSDALRTLDPVDRRILEMRFLAEPDARRTLAEVGVEIGLSRERTRQREIAALQQLMESLGAASDRVAAVRKLGRG